MTETSFHVERVDGVWWAGLKPYPFSDIGPCLFKRRAIKKMKKYLLLPKGTDEWTRERRYHHEEVQA